jgi:hypothetical protein
MPSETRLAVLMTLSAVHPRRVRRRALNPDIDAVERMRLTKEELADAVEFLLESNYIDESDGTVGLTAEMANRVPRDAAGRLSRDISKWPNMVGPNR